jgi:hypothetical protein
MRVSQPRTAEPATESDFAEIDRQVRTQVPRETWPRLAASSGRRASSLASSQDCLGGARILRPRRKESSIARTVSTPMRVENPRMTGSTRPSMTGDAASSIAPSPKPKLSVPRDRRITTKAHKARSQKYSRRIASTHSIIDAQVPIRRTWDRNLASLPRTSLPARSARRDSR